MKDLNEYARSQVSIGVLMSRRLYDVPYHAVQPSDESVRPSATAPLPHRAPLQVLRWLRASISARAFYSSGFSSVTYLLEMKPRYT